MGDPAGKTGKREHHGEHIFRDTHGTIENTGVEVNVGIERTVDEVTVGKGGFFNPAGDIEQRILAADPGKIVFTLFADDDRARVVGFVDPVTETHEPEGIVFVLRHFDEFIHIAVSVDHAELFDDRLIGTAVQRSGNR